MGGRRARRTDRKKDRAKKKYKGTGGKIRYEGLRQDRIKERNIAWKKLRNFPKKEKDIKEKENEQCGMIQ